MSLLLCKLEQKPKLVRLGQDIGKLKTTTTTTKKKPIFSAPNLWAKIKQENSYLKVFTYRCIRIGEIIIKKIIKTMLFYYFQNRENSHNSARLELQIRNIKKKIYSSLRYLLSASIFLFQKEI